MFGLDLSFPAFMSILALVVLVVISCVNENINVGYIGIGFGVLVGGLFSNLAGSAVQKFFPLTLFMLLAGVTFFFGMAQTNGTLQK